MTYLIIGSEGLLGKAIVTYLDSINMPYIRFARRTSTNRVINYSIGNDINSALPQGVNITRVIYLAHDYSRAKISGADINLVGISAAINYCKQKDCELIYISSLAVDAKSYYGRIKRAAETLVMQSKKFSIIRPGMIVSPGGGIINKLNSIFERLPFFIVPGTGNYVIYLSSLNKLTKYICNIKITNTISLAVDTGPFYLKDLLDLKNKVILNIPVFILKLLLVFPHLLKINTKSFSYDGICGIVSFPLLAISPPTYEQN